MAHQGLIEMFWQLCISTSLLICMCQTSPLWKWRWISIQTQIPSHLRTMAANYPNVTGGYDCLIDPCRDLPECNGPLKVKCFFFSPSINSFRNEETLGMEHLWYANVPVLWVSTIWSNDPIVIFAKVSNEGMKFLNNDSKNLRCFIQGINLQADGKHKP